MTFQQLKQRPKYRSELTMVLHILRVIKEKGDGIILSHISRKTNVDYQKALDLLEKLKATNITTEEFKIVSHVQNKLRKVYKITQNGDLFLNEIEKFYEFMNKYNLEIKL